MQPVDSFVFLQSTHSTALVCYRRPSWSCPSFAAVQRWCGREGQIVIAPPYIVIVFMKRNSGCESWFFCFSSVKSLRCMVLLSKATLKLPVFCCSATLMWGRRTSGNCPPLYYHCYEAKLFLWKLILLLFFSQWTPLHKSACYGHLEICRLLLQCNADIEAKDCG